MLCQDNVDGRGYSYNFHGYHVFVGTAFFQLMGTALRSQLVTFTFIFVLFAPCLSCRTTNKRGRLALAIVVAILLISAESLARWPGAVLTGFWIWMSSVLACIGGIAADQFSAMVDRNKQLDFNQ